MRCRRHRRHTGAIVWMLSPPVMTAAALNEVQAGDVVLEDELGCAKGLAMKPALTKIPSSPLLTLLANSSKSPMGTVLGHHIAH